MFTMGADFNYRNAIINLKNFDKLINYVNMRVSKHNLNTFVCKSFYLLL